MMKYSPSEQRMLKLLPRNGRKLTSVELVEKFYNGSGEAPYHARNIVITVLRSLRRKTAHNKEEFRVASTPRSGPIPMSFWLEQR